MSRSRMKVPDRGSVDDVWIRMGSISSVRPSKVCDVLFAEMVMMMKQLLRRRAVL